jgi:CDP-diacylglycerol--glycerol-3-phosphate 3-phosphatidyltransferase
LDDPEPPIRQRSRAAGEPQLSSRAVKLPNLVTLSRMVLAPAFLFAFLEGPEAGLRWALGLAVFFEVTDMVDGYLARRFEQTSQLGKILDPLADSISRFTVFLAFLVGDYASVWAVAPIFWRDSVVSTIRVLAASQGVIVSARFAGKVKAIVQGVAIVAILTLACARDLIGWTIEDVQIFSKAVMVYVSVVTVWSLFDYLWGNRKVLRSLDA